jgi:outer membrane protease
VSTADIGELGYVTIDLGWNSLRSAVAKLGPFVGYNYFTERWDVRGCAQIANRYSDCVPSRPTSTVGITENSTWNSLRVGINGETIVFDRLKLGADMAFLPYVSMSGRDNHLARTVQPTFFEQQGHGQGVQFETILSYYLTNDWTVGVGGRYWSLWTRGGTDTCTGCGGAGVVSHSSPAKFNTERYGMFLQSTYRFNVL